MKLNKVIVVRDIHKLCSSTKIKYPNKAIKENQKLIKTTDSIQRFNSNGKTLNPANFASNFIRDITALIELIWLEI